MIISAVRDHTISVGHRVANHESKCASLHGHNLMVRTTLNAAELDGVGRVLDFGLMKAVLVTWMEETWDHRFLVWANDPIRKRFEDSMLPGIIYVPFNPTAENIAQHLLTLVFPQLLTKAGYGHVKVSSVAIWETPKCMAEARLAAP